MANEISNAISKISKRTLRDGSIINGQRIQTSTQRQNKDAHEYKVTYAAKKYPDYYVGVNSAGQFRKYNRRTKADMGPAR